MYAKEGVTKIRAGAKPRVMTPVTNDDNNADLVEPTIQQQHNC